MKEIFKLYIDDKRIYGLDILRALAILFVVVLHGEFLMPKGSYTYINLFVFDGVSIFFVLSGFLIGGILIKILNTQKIDFKLLGNFWLRRWFRTIPNYLLILITLLFLNYFFSEDFKIFEYGRYFIFSQNLYWKHPNFFPEAWSLSVEEWFYLIIPLIIICAIKFLELKINTSILLTAFLIIISITLFRYFRFISLDEIISWDREFRKQVATRLDSVMYGILGSYIAYNYQNLWNKFKRPFFVLGLLLFGLVKFNLLKQETLGLFNCVFSFSVTSFATLCLLPYLSSVKRGKGLIFKIITYISLISYSMYLINLSIVQQWILGSINWGIIEDFNGYLFLIVRYLLYWILTITISLIIYKYFEIPLMKLRDKIRIK